MKELLEWMEYIEDTRQQSKVRHKLKDILVIVHGNQFSSKSGVSHGNQAFAVA